MKGLIIKDLYSLKKYTKSLMISLGILMFYGIFLKNTVFVGFFISFFAMSVILTVLGDDEMIHWDKYALCMPVDRPLMVREKYMLVIIILIGTGLASMLVGGGMAAALGQNVFYTLQMSYIAITMVSLVIAIIVPIFYKVGVQKTRYIMYACTLIPTALIVFFFNMVEKSVIVIKEEQLPSLMCYFNIIIPFVLGLLMYFSYKISLSIYKKKEW